jgi:hypothetical protein
VGYIQENRAQIREHIGRLMHGSRYLKDVVSAVGANTVSAVKAQRFGSDHYTGAAATFLDGPAAGVTTYVGASAAGTGALTLNPVPAAMPNVGDTFEVWPSDTSIDDVNDAINLAILDVQHLAASIAVLVGPTIDAERKRITVPSSWTMVSRLTYEYGGFKYKLRPRDPRDPMPWDQIEPVTFDIEGQAIVVWGTVPASATNLRLVGYAVAQKLADDTTPATVRSDFLVYKAAAILSQDHMAGELLDPEGSQRRAVFWSQQAEAKKREMNTQVLANTARLEEAL